MSIVAVNFMVASDGAYGAERYYVGLTTIEGGGWHVDYKDLFWC